MNVMAELTSRGTGRIDPWNTLDPSMVPAAECRTIPITDELRAADAKQREERERAQETAWPMKATLSLENLKRGPAKGIKPQRDSGRIKTIIRSAEQRPKLRVMGTNPVDALPLSEPKARAQGITKRAVVPLSSPSQSADGSAVPAKRLPARRMQTVLKAKTREEYHADQLWKRLSVADKWTLLEI